MTSVEDAKPMKSTARARMRFCPGKIPFDSVHKWVQEFVPAAIFQLVPSSQLASTRLIQRPVSVAVPRTVMPGEDPHARSVGEVISMDGGLVPNSTMTESGRDSRPCLSIERA